MADIDNDIDQLSINTIRTLSIDAIQKANSGHPGTPMDAAPAAYWLWQHILRYDPDDPTWPNRDRFVLSAGHASMLLYSLLHLAEVKELGPDGAPVREAVTLEDIEGFRQPGTKCPGHPEYGDTAGVECTTGPLGQGVAMSVGMALAGRWLASRYNRPGFELFDYNVYALAGDGCIMEGVSNEAASLAGHLQLGNLCWIYDRNQVTIEGHIDITFTEDVATRYLAYGWNVLRVGDANDGKRLLWAYQQFLQTNERPTLIIVESHIGYGSPHRQDTRLAHGEPLGAEEVRLTKEFYGWPADAQFLVPDGVRRHFRSLIGERGAAGHAEWRQRFERYRAQHPELAAELDAIFARELPAGWEDVIPSFPPDPTGMSTRDASHQVLNALGPRVPWLMGGSADLYPSTKTLLEFDGAGTFQAATPSGRNMHFGLREFAMAAVVNGMALSGLAAYGSTFLIFSDYARGAIRLSALMELPILYVFTHDSIEVGEDGPTHQPIEQLASLRAMPGLIVFRPADANECAEAYRAGLRISDRPVVIVGSRQKIPVIDRGRYASASGTARGGYVVADSPTGSLDVLLLATGSEVGLCLEARERLADDGVGARVVSLPSWELFDEQDEAYRDEVLPPAVRARVSVEEASTLGWERFVGLDGACVGMSTFGLSGPGKAVRSHFGFTVDHVTAAAKEQLQRAGAAAG